MMQVSSSRTSVTGFNYLIFRERGLQGAFNKGQATQAIFLEIPPPPPGFRARDLYTSRILSMHGHFNPRYMLSGWHHISYACSSGDSNMIKPQDTKTSNQWKSHTMGSSPRLDTTMFFLSTGANRWLCDDGQRAISMSKLPDWVPETMYMLFAIKIEEH